MDGVAGDRKAARDRGAVHGGGHRGRHDRRPGGGSRRAKASPPTRNCSNPFIARRPARCCGPACAWAASTRARTEQQLDALSRYGEHVGLAFQIVDDILDVEESSEALGKTAGKDAAAAQDHLPRGVRPGRIAAHGGSASALGAHEALRHLRRARANGCANSPISSCSATS